MDVFNISLEAAASLFGIFLYGVMIGIVFGLGRFLLTTFFERKE